MNHWIINLYLCLLHHKWHAVQEDGIVKILYSNVNLTLMSIPLYDL